MNVDTQFPPAPLATLPNRPSQGRSDQASTRPVDRPHHSEPANNQNREHAERNGVHKDTAQRSPEARSVRQESELSAEEQRELDKLKARDREVRAHEAAHKNAAGSLARGGAEFEFDTGPDGRRYAVGGEVSIDTSKVPGDPQATIDKAETIQRAATAPAQPSSQDRTVAAQASRMEAEARQELATEERDSKETGREGPTAPSTDSRFNHSAEPAHVGELIDVLV